MPCSFSARVLDSIFTHQASKLNRIVAILVWHPWKNQFIAISQARFHSEASPAGHSGFKLDRSHGNIRSNSTWKINIVPPPPNASRIGRRGSFGTDFCMINKCQRLWPWRRKIADGVFSHALLLLQCFFALQEMNSSMLDTLGECACRGAYSPTRCEFPFNVNLCHLNNNIIKGMLK